MNHSLKFKKKIKFQILNWKKKKLISNKRAFIVN